MRGEAIVTRAGIEGGAIYALSAELRMAIMISGQAILDVALRPDLESRDLIERLSAPKGKQSLSNFLRKAAHLSPVAIGLLQEAAKAPGLSLSSLSPDDLAQLINAVPDRTHRDNFDRTRHFDRGRNSVQRDRCRFHAPPLARHVCRGRDAGLGSADRWLSLAGVVRDRSRSGVGCAEVAVEIVGWAKRSVPTTACVALGGAHGASAPLPTLQTVNAASPAPRPAACR